MLEQINNNFEWIVIDDGSTDNTEKVFKDILNDNKHNFLIQYVKQSNGGKHRALNRGISLAEGDYIFIIDSDDYITNDAVEKIYSWINQIDNDVSFAGIAGLKQDFSNNIVGGRPMLDYVDATNLERKKMNLLGDKAEIYKTLILRRYPFPEFEGEKFLSEAVVWNRIANDGYKIRWFNEPIYYCEYRDDGLTQNINARYKASPRGFALYIKELIKYEKNIIKKIILAGLYNREIYNYNDLNKSSSDLDVPKWFVLFGTVVRKVLKK